MESPRYKTVWRSGQGKDKTVSRSSWKAELNVHNITLKRQPRTFVYSFTVHKAHSHIYFHPRGWPNYLRFTNEGTEARESQCGKHRAPRQVPKAVRAPSCFPNLKRLPDGHQPVLGHLTPHPLPALSRSQVLTGALELDLGPLGELGAESEASPRGDGRLEARNGGVGMIQHSGRVRREEKASDDSREGCGMKEEGHKMGMHQKKLRRPKVSMQASQKTGL